MPNDAYTTLENVELFHNFVALFLFKTLQKNFEVTEKYKSTKI